MFSLFIRDAETHSLEHRSQEIEEITKVSLIVIAGISSKGDPCAHDRGVASVQ
jgi:hypothetical protein